MRDGWAESFDPCSPYSYEARRWKGYERDPPLVSGTVLLIAAACLVFLGFVGADVSAFQARPVSVQVTSVEWYDGHALLTTSGGFSAEGSQEVALTLSCKSTCFAIYGATVGSPFQFVGFSVAYHPIQYVNVTVRTPSVAYNGPLVVTLELQQKAA